MRKLVVLVSGRGSNMQAIASACHTQNWPASIAAVVASRRDAPALESARRLGLVARAVDHRDFADRAAFDEALGRCLAELAPDLIVLAGFMRILGDAFIERHAGRIVNIHPSLLPAFPGLHTHRQALAAGVAAHGATVHAVTAALDGGPIIAQAVVPVLPGDDEARLAKRVLAAEHRLYPQVLQWLIEGRLTLGAAGISWCGQPPPRLFGGASFEPLPPLPDPSGGEPLPPTA